MYNIPKICLLGWTRTIMVMMNECLLSRHEVLSMQGHITIQKESRSSQCSTKLH